MKFHVNHKLFNSDTYEEVCGFKESSHTIYLHKETGEAYYGHPTSVNYKAALTKTGSTVYHESRLVIPPGLPRPCDTVSPTTPTQCYVAPTSCHHPLCYVDVEEPPLRTTTKHRSGGVSKKKRQKQQRKGSKSRKRDAIRNCPTTKSDWEDTFMWSTEFDNDEWVWYISDSDMYREDYSSPDDWRDDYYRDGYYSPYDRDCVCRLRPCLCN